MSRRVVVAAALVLKLVASSPTSPLVAGLTAELWSTTYWGGGPGGATVAPNVDFVNYTFANFSSARLSGTVEAPDATAATFVLTTDGVARLWVDDHLLIDVAAPANASTVSVTAVAIEPFVFGASPAKFRLDYAHYSGPPATLVLAWARAGDPAPSVVPPSAFTTAVSPAEAARQALRARTLAPPVPWQTWWNMNMAAHVLMPTGFAVAATLGEVATGKLLGDVIVFRRSDPAIVVTGPHSPNGSDFTEVTVSRWLGAACAVTLRTTTAPGLGPDVDLALLATAEGADCGRFALVVRPQFLWGFAGTAAQVDEATFDAAVPGRVGGALRVASVSGPRVATFPDAGPTYLAWRLADGGPPVGLCTGYVAARNVSALAAAMAAQRAVTVARRDAFPGDLADAWDILTAVIYWNTIYTPYEGVVTPVSRGWDFGANYVIFDWDNLFMSFAAGFDPLARDIAYSNLIQIVLARTQAGFVPNYASGLRVSRDRTEPQIGAFVVRELFRRFNDTWVVELLFDALLSWHQWVWDARRGAGSLVPPGANVSDLVVLGSTPYPNASSNDWSVNLMQGARYESGLDNSPMYDGPDGDSQGAGPVLFDNVTTHQMGLYDSGMTGLFLSDTDALIDLAGPAGREDVLPMLRERFARVAAATNAHLWSDAEGAYVNVLLNGTAYPRLSPTAVFPLISGAASDAQAAAVARFTASPTGLCLNASYAGADGDVFATPLAQWWRKETNASEATASDDAHAQAARDSFVYVRVEAVVRNGSDAAGGGPGVLPLNLFFRPSPPSYALTTDAAGPAPGFALVRREGWCFAAPPAPRAANLTLWHSAAHAGGDFRTCGTAACTAAAATANYTLVRGLCYGYDGTDPTRLPCRYGGNSIQRSDPAFVDNNYWRGRIWGPHAQLLYWALRRYDHVPEARAARQSLVEQGARLGLTSWRGSAQVCENAHGVIGVCEDAGNADPWYSWGLLFTFLGFQESGLY